MQIEKTLLSGFSHMQKNFNLIYTETQVNHAESKKTLNTIDKNIVEINRNSFIFRLKDYYQKASNDIVADQQTLTSYAEAIQKFINKVNSNNQLINKYRVLVEVRSKNPFNESEILTFLAALNTHAENSANEMYNGITQGSKMKSVFFSENNKCP